MEGMLKEGAMEGKTIIITGGGTGLGKSMGKYFLELGANLVITSRKMEVLERSAEELIEATGEFNHLEAKSTKMWDQLAASRKKN